MLKEFEEEVQKSDFLVCFGIGKRFIKFRDLFSPNETVVSKIYCGVDNDVCKQGKEIDFAGKMINVWSIQQLSKLVEENKNKNYLFIITCQNPSPINEQLQNSELLRGIKVVFFNDLYAFIEEEDACKKVIPPNFKLTDKELIPRKIHYCWFGHNPLPEKYIECMESWKKYCPDYEIIQWNEDNYDVTQNRYMNDAYMNRKWAFVSDYARLDIVYQEGGIYLDTDVELLSPLDDLLYQKGFMGFINSEYVATGLGFGAISGLEIIKELRDDYEQIKFCDEHGNLNLTTCSVNQIGHLVERGLKRNGEYQIIDGLTIYPVKVLCGMNLISKQINLLPYTVAIHHFGGSWLDNAR